MSKIRTLARLFDLWKFVAGPSLGSVSAEYRNLDQNVYRMRLAATYSSLIMMLSILTATTVDKDVWFRDIAGSPSPFPLAVCLYSTKLWFTDTGISSNTREHPHCLPRCSCKEKISPSSPPMALPPLGIRSDHRLDGCANARSIVPGVRVPTALERHNSIFVGLEV
jgi:hypothetical protein